MASRAHPGRPPPALVTDVLEQIFLRVSSPADLARAAAACVAFRSLINSPSFLRRYRSVHPPLLLGFINHKGFHPVEATHPSAAVARGVAPAFDLSFLPHGDEVWCVNDVRDGRVLVGRNGYWDIAVCDPLFRQYQLLPLITDDLLTSVGLHNKDICYSRASLIPSGSTVEEGDISYRVICWMFSNTRLAVFVFSSTSPAHWDAVKSISWADLGLPEGIVNALNGPGQYVYGCYYWKLYGRNELLKLGMDTMEFSKYDLPPNHDKRTLAIVESGEGKVVMFSTLCQGPVEYYTFMQNGTDKSHNWCLKSTIPLPAHGPSNWFLDGQAEGYVFLAHSTEAQDLEYFSLDVKSYSIERACRISERIRSPPYFGFPPFMSPSRIRGGHGKSAWRSNKTVDRAI